MGERQGLTREDHEGIKRLKHENAELRRANEVLKLASTFFAAGPGRLARWREISQVFFCLSGWESLGCAEDF